MRACVLTVGAAGRLTLAFFAVLLTIVTKLRLLGVFEVCCLYAGGVTERDGAGRAALSRRVEHRCHDLFTAQMFTVSHF